MKIKIFIRTFTTAEDAEMFNSVLHTKWPTLLEGKSGARFRLLFDPKKPHVSTVIWEFENENIQKEIEKIISDEIVKFTKVLSNKEMDFSGKVVLDFVA
ncbi:transcriptional regulator [bacterium]|nr:transcriptional regulator [bacterium]